MDRYAKIFPVRWADCDANGHVRNTAYSEYAIDVRMAFFDEHGFGFERFVEAGIGPVALREETDYLREVRLGDTVEVDLAVVGLSPEGGRVRFAHEFRRSDGTRSARLVILGGWMDLRARRLVAPPPPLLAAMRELPRGVGYEDLPPLRRI